MIPGFYLVIRSAEFVNSIDLILFRIVQHTSAFSQQPHNSIIY